MKGFAILSRNLVSKAENVFRTGLNFSFDAEREASKGLNPFFVKAL